MTKSGCFPRWPALHEVYRPLCLYPGLGFCLTGTPEVKADPSKWSPGRSQEQRSFENIGLSQSQIETACDLFCFLCWVIRQVIFAGSLMLR